MTIFNRISNIFRAKINSTLEELENPIELLDQKIIDMEYTLNEAKLSSAKILGNVHEINRAMENICKESNDYVEKIKVAVNKGNEDLGKKFLQKKLDNDKYYNSLKISYDNASMKSESLKLKLRDLEKDIYETKIYRNDAFARYNAAEASKKINEVICNISNKDNTINLYHIEKNIEKRECFVAGLEDLNSNNNLNKEFSNLNNVDLDLELKKYV